MHVTHAVEKKSFRSGSSDLAGAPVDPLALARPFRATPQTALQNYAQKSCEVRCLLIDNLRTTKCNCFLWSLPELTPCEALRWLGSQAPRSEDDLPNRGRGWFWPTARHWRTITVRRFIR